MSAKSDRCTIHQVCAVVDKAMWANLDIEAKKYDASQFINELKEQLTNIVNDVLADNSTRKIGDVEGNKEK